MIEIRRYRDADYDDVKINLEEGALFNDSVDTRESLGARIQANPDSILVATVGDKVVGSVYILEDRWNSFIFRLAVRKDFRERGIGSRLMEESENVLRTKRIRNVALFVRSNHEELVDYYKNRGYTPMDMLHQCMWKDL